MHVTEDVKLSRSLLVGSSRLRQEDRALLEDNLDCLKERLGALGSALGQRCDNMRTRAQELTAYQVRLVHHRHTNSKKKNKIIKPKQGENKALLLIVLCDNKATWCIIIKDHHLYPVNETRGYISTSLKFIYTIVVTIHCVLFDLD